MLENYLKGLERKPGGDYRGGGGSFKQQGYLPLKATIPEQLGKQPEKWREWKRDISGYVDSITNGMKKFLNSVELHEGDISDEWVEQQSLLYGRWIITDREAIWRTLHQLTKDETKKIVLGAPDDGWNAWRRLCEYFNPSLAAMEGESGEISEY